MKGSDTGSDTKSLTHFSGGRKENFPEDEQDGVHLLVAARRGRRDCAKVIRGFSRTLNMPQQSLTKRIWQFFDKLAINSLALFAGIIVIAAMKTALTGLKNGVTSGLARVARWFRADFRAGTIPD